MYYQFGKDKILWVAGSFERIKSDMSGEYKNMSESIGFRPGATGLESSVC